MNTALYPQTADELASHCPYCGSERLTNNHRDKPTERKHSIEVRCGDCEQSHNIHYTATSITLMTADDPLGHTEFFLPITQLEDQAVHDPKNTETVPVGICTGRDALILTAYGYGDFGSCWGFGSAVVIENYEGSLRLLIWADINREDAVQIIDLSPAKETTREDDGVFPFRAKRFDRRGLLIEEHIFESADEAQSFASSSLANIPGHRAVVCLNAARDDVLWDSKDAEGSSAVDRNNNRMSVNSASGDAECVEGAGDSEGLCDCERPGYFFLRRPRHSGPRCKRTPRVRCEDRTL